MADRHLVRVYLGPRFPVQDLAGQLQGCTVLQGIGYWQGQCEACSVVEVSGLTASGIATLKLQLQKLIDSSREDCVLVSVQREVERFEVWHA